MFEAFFYIIVDEDFRRPYVHCLKVNVNVNATVNVNVSVSASVTVNVRKVTFVIRLKRSFELHNWWMKIPGDRMCMSEVCLKVHTSLFFLPFYHMYVQLLQ